MSITEAHARIKARVWKAVAQSKLDLSALPEETLEALVDMVSESALMEMDEEIGKTLAGVDSAESTAEKQPQAAPEEDTNEGEKILWQGRPFLSITKHYRITNERIRITDGVLSKRRVDIEMVKIQDINQTQKASERMINVGDITIRSNDRSNPLIVLDNVADVQRVHEIIRRAVIEARADANFSYREEM